MKFYYLFKSLVFTALLSISFFSKSASLKIKIFSEYKFNSVWISSLQGSYFIYADGKEIYDLPEKIAVHLAVNGDSVGVKINNNLIGSYKKVKLIGRDSPNSFKIKPLNSSVPERAYDDNLEIITEKNNFKFINRVNIDHYVAGVVESENGSKENFEYYKTKSIICRTYALSNVKKHEEDGYNLCDQVHCQVYKSKSYLNPEIVSAALATTDVVLVDNKRKLIVAAFHSNCGGQTINSEEQWNYPTTYLKSVKDTFCLRGAHAVWERKIPVKEWENYLIKKHQFQLDDSVHWDCFFNYIQNEKELDFATHNLRIPLKTLRSDLNLRSTYFSFVNENDTIVIHGKGYGHGIGLCQEGAMRMAKLGYKFNEILRFYYKDIYLVDLSVLDFIKE